MPSKMTAKKLNQPPVVRHDLTQCPFCGASPEIEFYHGGGPNKRLISCPNRECHVNPSVTGEGEREAVERWERRAP